MQLVGRVHAQAPPGTLPLSSPAQFPASARATFKDAVVGQACLKHGFSALTRVSTAQDVAVSPVSLAYWDLPGGGTDKHLRTRACTGILGGGSVPGVGSEQACEASRQVAAAEGACIASWDASARSCPGNCSSRALSAAAQAGSGGAQGDWCL